MELTVWRSLLVALPVVAVFFLCGLSASDAQRIDAFSPQAGYETRKNPGRGEFPRREELLKALNFLEEYERGKENDWNKNMAEEEGLLDNGGNDVNLGLDDIYPLGYELDNGAVQDDTFPEYYDEEEQEEDNQVEIPPWLAATLLEESQEEPAAYLEEEPGDVLDDEELLEIALEEEEALQEAEEAAYLDEIEREEEEVIADIVEEEMENEAVDNILEDLWAEDLLQKDAERQLKWLLVEEEDKMRREDAEEMEMEMEEEEEKEEQDPFDFGYVYSAEDIPPANAYDYEDYPSFLEDLFEEDPLGSSDEDLLANALDASDEEELPKDAEEILDYPEEEDEEDEEMQATGALQRLIGSLTREAIQEELQAENSPDQMEEAEEEEEEEGDENIPASILDAGMGVDEETEGEGDEDEEIEKEVYSELVELLSEEIDLAINDVAEEIIEELEKEEEEEEEEGVDDEGVLVEGDYGDMETEDEEPEVMTGAGAGDVCPALQYFIDDCNIVNNYADLGGSGYKDLFAGACNRHQLCYACGAFYQVGAKLCDELFKAELLAHCDTDDDDCRERAKYFWLVARSNRLPDMDSPPICGDTCVLSYLVEV